MNSQNDFVSQLAKFLRLNGDRVINGESKLSLITCALCILNNMFDSILFTADAKRNLKNAGDSEELFEDVKFLLDFMKKTPSLKVFHGGQTLRGGIDVSRFSKLKVLELHKVPMHLVIGLNNLCPQLAAFFCHRSICSLKEIFGNVETETNLKGIWSSLKELNISHNYLEGFDQSLGVMPAVEYIDASHNNLKYIDEIQVLEKLTFLNLSYNRLENVPVLSGLSSYSLKVLFLRNNILEDLEGLEMLPSLEELDVSYNCISEHSSLRALKKLHTLKSLNLECNPVYFHKRHRILTIKHLHSSVLSRGILLNHKVTGPEEVLEIMRSVRSTSFYAQNSSTHQTAINVLVDVAEGRNELIAEPTTPVMKPKPKFEFGFDESSIASTEENISGSVGEISDFDEPVHKTRKKKKTKKHKALVHEINSIDPVVSTETNGLESNTVPSHILTKQMFEARRREYREGWLIPRGGFEKYSPNNNNTATNVPPNTPAVSNIPQTPPTDTLTTKVPDAITSDAALEQAKFMDDTLEKLKVYEAKPEEPLKESSPLQQEGDFILRNDFQQGDMNANHDYSFSRQHEYEHSDSSDESDNESEGCLFLVDLKFPTHYISLCAMVRENSIKEIDSISGKVHDRLDLRCLLSVELNNIPEDEQYVSELRLSFDTANTSRQKKIYFFDCAESAKSMYLKLKPFADAKVLEDSTMGALQCLKCGSQFSKEVAEKRVIKKSNTASSDNSSDDMSKEVPKETSACPNCGSIVVVEIDSMPVPSLQVSTSTIPMRPTAGSKLNTRADILNLSSVLAAGMKSRAEYNMYSPSTERRMVSSGMEGNNISKEKAGSHHSDIDQRLAASDNATSKEDNLSLKARKNSDQTIDSNRSSSITVISDTESNLDVAPEKITLYSPVPPSPDVSSGFLESSPTANATNGSETEDRAKTTVSSSVTESLVNEDRRRFNSDDSANTDLKNIVRCSNNVDLVAVFEGRERFNGETFTSIDHRLKLHLEVGIFDNEETLLACLPASIVPAATGEEFDGLVVISSKKLYIMNVLKDNSDDRFEKSLKQVYVCGLKQLKRVQVLLGNQGLIMSCNSDKSFLILVRDADFCNCFNSLLIDIVNERLAVSDRPEFSLETAEYLSQVNAEIFSPSSIDVEEEDQEMLLHLFGYFQNSEISKKLSVCFIVTPSHIHVAKLVSQKQSRKDEKYFAYHYVPLEKHRISDLIEVIIQEDLLAAKIVFEDEERNVASECVVSTPTKSSLFSFISAFKGPWDSIFHIELPLSVQNF